VVPEDALEVVVDHLEVRDEIPLGAESGGAVQAEVNVLVLLTAVQRQVSAQGSTCALCTNQGKSSVADRDPHKNGRPGS